MKEVHEIIALFSFGKPRKKERGQATTLFYFQRRQFHSVFLLCCLDSEKNDGVDDDRNHQYGSPNQEQG